MSGTDFFEESLGQIIPSCKGYTDNHHSFITTALRLLYWTWMVTARHYMFLLILSSHECCRSPA